MQELPGTILGQTYVPKHCTEHSFSWHATFRLTTFVPPHHPDQDEYLYILEGKLDFMLAGAETRRHRRSGAAADGHPAWHLQQVGQDREKLFWVSPTRRLYDLFLEHPQSEGEKPEEVRRARRRTQHPLPAAATGRVSSA